MPTPATATPTGRSQIAPRRSDNRPKSGWITDDETAEASMRVAARVYERPKRSTRNGRSAGSAPFAKSVPRCPAPRSAIARLSMPARTSASVAAGASGGAFERRLGFASGPDAQRGDRRRRHGDHLDGGEADENRVGARRAQDRPADGQPERAREDEDGPHRRQRAGRIAGGGRRVRMAWIGGFTRPLKSPERKIAASITVAVGWKTKTPSGRAWP